MSLNPKIFKAYDIRGLAPGELDEDAAYRIGQATVKFTKAKTVVVGQDMRTTSPVLFAALVKGIVSQGADVIDVGLVSTPMFYFAVGDYDLHDAGIMVTASHNPKEYNGFKLCFGDVLPIGAESGMDQVRDLALAGPYPAKPEGHIVETDVKAAYLAKLGQMVNFRKIKPLKVVVDAGNGMAGVVIEDLFRRLPQCQMTGLFLEPDGNFPNHEANPLKEETLDALKAEVRRSGADLGVAFDGDADRVGFVDERGQAIRGDVIQALLAGKLLQKNPGEAVTYSVNAGLIVPEEVERHGGRAIMSRVGHGVVKPFMRRHNALFGGEISMHYYYRDFFTAECTDLAMLQIFELLTETGRQLSEIIAPLERHCHSGEINSKVEDKEAILAQLEETYSHEAAAVTKMDGLRLDFKDANHPEEDWWFNVRASNTEPLLRLNLEAKSKEKMEAKRDELLKIIRA